LYAAAAAAAAAAYCAAVNAPQVMLNGKERTVQQWEQLLGEAGFTIKEIENAPSMAAIVAVPSK
jgi:hypothetical protein